MLLVYLRKTRSHLGKIGEIRKAWTTTSFMYPLYESKRTEGKPMSKNPSVMKQLALQISSRYYLNLQHRQSLERYLSFCLFDKCLISIKPVHKYRTSVFLPFIHFWTARCNAVGCFSVFLTHLQFLVWKESKQTISSMSHDITATVSSDYFIRKSKGRSEFLNPYLSLSHLISASPSPSKYVHIWRWKL